MKKIARRAIELAGYEIRSASDPRDPLVALVNAFKHFNVDVVLDVGANIGQFGELIRRRGYQGRIVSFEPLTSAHACLRERAARDGKWEVHPRVAVGAVESEIEINISENSYSSSILPMLATHRESAAGSGYVGTEMTPVVRLDSVAGRYVSEREVGFVKIDTQGYEEQVIDGGLSTLERCVGLRCELSLVPLYGGQKLWREIFDRIEALGFRLWALDRGFSDSHTGQTLQVDATFFRPFSG